MSLLNRMIGTEQPNISAHQFSSALLGLADGRLTRGQIETAFNIATTGADATELNFIIDTYTGVLPDDFSSVPNAPTRGALENDSLRRKRNRYLQTLHAIFLLTEHDSFTLAFTKADVQQWLQDSVAVEIL